MARSVIGPSACGCKTRTILLSGLVNKSRRLQYNTVLVFQQLGNRKNTMPSKSGTYKSTVPKEKKGAKGTKPPKQPPAAPKKGGMTKGK
jgi:hypothetical protein